MTDQPIELPLSDLTRRQLEELQRQMGPDATAGDVIQAAVERLHQEEMGFAWPTIRFGMIKDERLVWLVREVWLRLPTHDRLVLEALVSDVDDHGRTPQGRVAAVRVVDADTVIDGNACLVAKDLHLMIQLGRTEGPQWHAVEMYVIAHEFAHVVLRHNQMSVVVEHLSKLAKFRAYSKKDYLQLDAWDEEAADLQACVWGFEEGMRAFYEAYPEAGRPRWDVEFTQELGEP